MEIQKKYLNKYLHDIAVKQLTDDYKSKGYEVFTDRKIGSYIADIVAIKDDDKVVLEVKSGKMSPERRKKLASIADLIQESGEYRFMVVIATPPKEKKLAIHDFDEILWEYLNFNIPDEINILSTHTRMDKIIDIDLNGIEIKGKSVYVTGNGVLGVELQYGSDGDQTKGNGITLSDSYPFSFNIKLEYNKNKVLEITDVDSMKVDTTSFYE